MQNRVKVFFFELLLWNLANVVCTVLPTGLVYFIGKYVVGWGPGSLAFYLSATVFATLTWGSWAALVWTSERPLRVGMRFSTLLPGLLTIIAGGAGLWVGFGAWFLWVGVIASGLAMLVVSNGLARAFRPLNREPSAASYLVGLGVYPLATSALGLGVGALWHHFITTPPDGSWRDLVSIATLFMTVLAAALVTTVVPAATSSGLRKISADLI